MSTELDPRAPSTPSFATDARRTARHDGHATSGAATLKDEPRQARLARLRLGGRLALRPWPALALGAALLLLWQWYASRPEVDPLLLPAPTAVWAALVAQRGILWHHTLVTLGETAVGFAAALAAGRGLGAAVDIFWGGRGGAPSRLVGPPANPLLSPGPLPGLWVCAVRVAPRIP